MIRAAHIAVAAVVGAAGAVHAEPAPGAKAAAPADTESVIGLLDVRVEGLSPDAAKAFTRKIEEALELSGLKVASSDRLRTYLAGTPWNQACLLGPCLGELMTHAELRSVIEVALATSGPSYHYVITLLDTVTGKPLNQVAAKCDVCTTEEAFTEASLAVVALVNGIGGQPAPPPPIDLAAVRESSERRVARARSRTRWIAVAMLGTAAAAAAGSWYWFRDDRDTLGGASAGAAGALGLLGFTTLGVSFTF